MFYTDVSYVILHDFPIRNQVWVSFVIVFALCQISGGFCPICQTLGNYRSGIRADKHCCAATLMSCELGGNEPCNKCVQGHVLILASNSGLRSAAHSELALELLTTIVCSLTSSNVVGFFWYKHQVKGEGRKNA